MKTQLPLVVHVFLVLLLPLSIAALAQRSAPQMGSTPAPPDTITRPGSLADSGVYDYWTQMSGQGRAGGVLLGKLTVEGETLPWEPILVAVVCKGTNLHTTETDAKGR